MEILVVLSILLIFAVIIGAVLGFVNNGKISTLKQEVSTLKRQVGDLQAANLKLQAQFKQISNTLLGLTQQTLDDKRAPEQIQNTAKQAPAQQVIEPIPTNPAPIESAPAVSPTTPTFTGSNNILDKQNHKDVSNTSGWSLEKFLMGNGLLWLGGAVLALGGVFMAKYSIEAGLLPPAVRILLGTCFGVGLIVLAEYLLRFPDKFKLQGTTVNAALASGGLITCYAMALVAFDFYAFIPAGIAFALLAIIAIAAAWASLRYGPILAAIGVIGAYAVPALVSTGSNNVMALLLYVLAVSLSTVWVYQVVKREWVWVLGIVGHFAWYAIGIILSVEQSLAQAAVANLYSNIGIITVFGLGSIYLFTLMPILGWRFQFSQHQALSTKLMLMPRKEQLGVILPLLGIVFYVFQLGYQPQLVGVFTVYALVFCILPSRHSAFDTWPFLGIAFALFVFCLMPNVYDASDMHSSNLFAFSGAYLFIQVVALFALVYAFGGQILYPQRHAFSLLLVSAPLILYGVAYALANAFNATLNNTLSNSGFINYLYPVFAIELGIIALFASIASLKTTNTMHKLSYLLLANGAVALVFTMLLSASTLTLSLSAQIALMVWLSNRYAIALPDWIYKIAIVGVGLRLTLAPWLPEYAGEFLLGIHWSIIVYPLAFGVLFFAYKHVQVNSLKHWFEGALLHLIALFLTTETSYLLVGGYPNFIDLSFAESALLGTNYIILALVYLYRAQFASNPKMYHGFAILLCVVCTYIHLDASLFSSPFITTQSAGTYLLANWFTPLWLIPALVLLIMAKFNFVHNKILPATYVVSGLFLVFTINANIRLGFVDNVSYWHSAIEQGELYTYSIVYLLGALVLIVIAQYLTHQTLTKLGFAVLSMVVLKAFLVDMSNLEGLFRAMSFIGLGLTLVGIGWLFQRLKKSSAEDIDDHI